MTQIYKQSREDLASTQIPYITFPIYLIFSQEIITCIYTYVYEILRLECRNRFALLPERSAGSIASKRVAIPEHWEFSWKLLPRFDELRNDGIVFEDISIVMLLDFTFVGSIGREVLIEPLASLWGLLPLLLRLLFVSENSNSKFSGSVFRTWKIFVASSCIARACKNEGLSFSRWRESRFYHWKTTATVFLQRLNDYTCLK